MNIVREEMGTVESVVSVRGKQVETGKLVGDDVAGQVKTGAVGQVEAVGTQQELPSGSGRQKELQQAADSNEVTEMDTDGEGDSDCVSVADSLSQNAEIYSLEEIHVFLEESFGKAVEVRDFFPDTNKFLHTVSTLQKVVGLDLLDENKRYRLRKHVTAMKKGTKESKRGKKLKISK